MRKQKKMNMRSTQNTGAKKPRPNKDPDHNNVLVWSSIILL